MIEVLLTRVTPVAGVPPKLSVTPVRKLVPVIVTVVPPLVVPELGVINVTVGAGLDGEPGDLGVLAKPPPQPGKESARINREKTGNQYLRDIRKS